MLYTRSVFETLTACFFVVTLTVNCNAQTGTQAIVVGSDIQVSKAYEKRSHGETVLVVDPQNPKHLLGAAMVFNPSKDGPDIILYASFDGGNNWEPTLEVGRGWITGDPTIAFGPNGRAYFVCLSRPHGIEKDEMLVYQSTDSGKTWSTPTILPFNDRPYVIVDNTRGRYHGRIYIHGNGVGIDFRNLDGRAPPGSLRVYRSTDGGLTFLEPVRLASSRELAIALIGNGVVLSDGTFVVLIGEFLVSGAEWQRLKKAIDITIPTSSLKVMTSNDGGESFAPAVTVSDWYTPRKPGTFVPPNIAADLTNSPFRDRLYVAWSDERSGRTVILLSRSTDKGKTWSKPIQVNDDRPRPAPGQGPDNFMPTIAVNRDGVVGVMWYDRRDYQNNLDFSPRFAVSFDGGETFEPSIRVSEGAFAHDWSMPETVLFYSYGSGGRSPTSRGGTVQIGVVPNQRGGETSGLATDADGVFHPFWIDNRTGIPQVWTTYVKVRDVGVRNGSANLQELDDLTNDVALKFANSKYDPVSNTISADVQIMNTSPNTLGGPLKVRVLSVESERGSVEILNADNGKRQQGAVWDFSSPMTAGMLKPGEMTASKRIVFRISARVGRAEKEPDAYGTFALVDAIVLGREQKAFK